MKKYAPILAVAGSALLTFALALQGAAGNVQARRAGQTDKILAASHLTLASALKVDLSTDTATLPLHRGNYHGTPVWYILTDASDIALAHDLGINYSPKIGNAANGCAACVQVVTETAPKNNMFGEAVVNFQGVPDFSPMRILVPSAQGFPPLKSVPGAVAGPHYSPFIRFSGTNVIYNAPIIATGAGPFDVVQHTNTADRVLKIDTKNMTVDLLLIQGYAAGLPIVYVSTEASIPLAATLERAVYVPALANLPFQGGDSFLGSARERIYVVVNGETGAHNPLAQGLNHLILDGHAAEDASASNTKLLKALVSGGDTQNIQGDFPTELNQGTNAYSPIWDVQLSQWSAQVIAKGDRTRLTSETQVLDAVSKGWLTGPGGAPYGASGFIVNCPAIGYTAQPPTGA